MITSNPQASQSEIVGHFPLSTIQQQFWFLDQLHPGNPVLNIAVCWELQGKYRKATLEQAYRIVIERHEILRSCFIENDGQAEQQVHSHVDFEMDEYDIRDFTGPEQQSRLAAIKHEQAVAPFDLLKTGMIRATLIHLEDERAMLLTVAHHMVFDGYSIGVLGREIGTISEALDSGMKPELSELELQYGDVCLWQEQYLSSGVLDEETDFWREQMKGAPYFEFPTDRPRPKVLGTDVRHQSRTLPQAFRSNILQACEVHATTPFAFGAAVVSNAMYELTGVEEVLLGTPIAGRDDIDLETLIGPLINTQVLRLKTPAGQNFATHMSQTKAVVEDVLVNQNMPFSKLVEIVNPVRDASRAPLVSVDLTLRRVFMEDQQYGDFKMISVPSFPPGGWRDLDIIIIDRPVGGWRINVGYSPDLYDESTIQRLLDQIIACFDQAFTELNLPKMVFDAPENNPLGYLDVDDILAETLAKHPLVQDAATIKTDVGIWGYVAPATSPLVALETLPALLMEDIASDLAGVSVIANIPRFENGSVDYQSLPKQPSSLPKPTLFRNTDGDLKSGLIQIWQELLGRTNIPTSKSFFDLGGHSLLAIRMISRVRSTWSVPMGVATIYDHPSIDSLVKFLSQNVENLPVQSEVDWRVEPIRTEGTGPTVFAINDVSIILSTSEFFEKARPSMCVRLFDQSRGIDQFDHTFEEISAEYAKIIQKYQPRGPYLLYGACVHANIALEAARYLQSQGHEITGVVIKDCWEPSYAAKIEQNYSTLMREKFYALANKFRQVRKGRMSLTAMLGSYRIIRGTGILQLATRLGIIDRVRATDLTAEQEGFVAYISNARDVYRPKPFDFPVLHLVTKITAQGKGFMPSIGWENVAENIKTVQLDDISVIGGEHSGTDKLAKEIEIFLSEQR